jgi:F-type H+-transporting ATPase subunit epsilon
MSTAAAAAPFWRAAGMTYIGYSNICATLMRGCLKEPFKSEAASRAVIHFSVAKWADGKQEKSSECPSLPPSPRSVHARQPWLDSFRLYAICVVHVCCVRVLVFAFGFLVVPSI